MNSLMGQTGPIKPQLHSGKCVADGGGAEVEGSERLFWEEGVPVPSLLVCEREVGMDSGSRFVFTLCHPLGDKGAGACFQQKESRDLQQPSLSVLVVPCVGQ